MRLAPAVSILATVLIVTAAVVSYGPYYTTTPATVFLALTKLTGLIVSGVAGIVVWVRFGRGSPQRRPWLVLGVALLLMASGQSVLAFHQIFDNGRAPFPSIGDPLFVVSAGLVAWAMVAFAWQAFHSGLPLGTPLRFWSPAMIIAVICAVAAYPLLGPIARAPAQPAELFLNLYYPSASFVTLAPLAVMQRVGVTFRGGELTKVWLPLTLGFCAVLGSDVLFAWFSTLGYSWLDRTLDFLYLAGYWLIPAGIVAQADLAKA